MRRLERAVSRANGLVVFAALLVAGAVLTASDTAVGGLLMGLSVLPLAWALRGGLFRGS